MSVTDRIEDEAIAGRFGIGAGVAAIGNKIGQMIPSGARSEIRDETSSPAIDFTTRTADLTDYTFERTPGGRVASNAGDAADNAANAVSEFVDNLQDALPSANALKVVLGIVAVLVGATALGQLFDVQVGGS